MTASQTLIDVITDKTQSLKDQYIIKTKQWSATQFTAIDSLTEDQVKQERGYDFTWNSKTSRCHTKASYAYWNKVLNIKRAGKQAYIDLRVKHAQQHYVDSVAKLALRITSKNLNVDTMTVVHSHVGVNLEITFTDGVQTVRAWTIIAEGPIKAPHYRYLVK